MEQNGAYNVIWKVVSRDTEFDDNSFDLEFGLKIYGLRLYELRYKVYDLRLELII